ncbi:hypothetical protein [Gordonia soli]|uniref:MPT63-like domain-containing protein n=1 Tax=Gordonia soli NBRC 108243 TaxID=1223545 RepID=M0QE46_9ACTN|nr:hypothetical protein [Gordonia soli]GAC66848.1 hypothetical protein GS4_05_00570 [Gordonia soli NBRC 108243]
MTNVRRSLGVVAVAISISAVAFGVSPAHAAPTTDPAARLVAAGVPASIAETATSARPVAADVEQINLANPRNGNPGMKVDAVIDHRRATITVIQRDLIEPSALTTAWVNLRTGAAGRIELSGSAAGNRPLGYPDRVGVVHTGAGPVILVVYGSTPPQTGLIPRLNYILPIPHLISV